MDGLRRIRRGAASVLARVARVSPVSRDSRSKDTRRTEGRSPTASEQDGLAQPPEIALDAG